MSILVFQLSGPFASWGEAATGEERQSAATPGRSALSGLLGAALGIRRDQESDLASLQNEFHYSVACVSSGAIARDYHTAQVPSAPVVKKFAVRTRRDELLIDPLKLNTVISSRWFLQGASYWVAVRPLDGIAPSFDLLQLQRALQEPRFCLYLGRKSFVLDRPTWPKIIDVPVVKEAFDEYGGQLTERLKQADQYNGSPLGYQSIHFDQEAQSGHGADLVTRRKDRVIRRKGWLFEDGIEYVKLLGDQT